MYASHYLARTAVDDRRQFPSDSYTSYHSVRKRKDPFVLIFIPEPSLYFRTERYESPITGGHTSYLVVHRTKYCKKK